MDLAADEALEDYDLDPVTLGTVLDRMLDENDYHQGGDECRTFLKEHEYETTVSEEDWTHLEREQDRLSVAVETFHRQHHDGAFPYTTCGVEPCADLGRNA
jgi:hypothetical protein